MVAEIPASETVPVPERVILKEGRLLVLTGPSCAGKDETFNKLLQDEFLQSLSYQRIVTCTDRNKRGDEVHGVHYYFHEKGSLQTMYEQGLLVEPPKLYGSDYKATPKIALMNVVYLGIRGIWRIEPSLAADVVTGKLFDTMFSTQESAFLKQSTAVVFITADQETLVQRRKERHKEDYEAWISEYEKRDRQDWKVLEEHGHLFANVINNPNGSHSHTVAQVVQVAHSLHPELEY